MLHQQNTVQATLYEDEFPSLSETESKDFTNFNLSSTVDSLSYCAKLKTSQYKNVQTEREICSDESFYKPVISKSIQTNKQDLITNSHCCYESPKFSGKFSENNSLKKSNSQLLNFSQADDQELVTFSDQCDEKDKGWVVVKKKIPHCQTDENNKIFTKTKNNSFLKMHSMSVSNMPLPKHRVQKMPCTSKKNYFYDSKISSNKLSSLQNNVTDSNKSNNLSNYSKNVKFHHDKVESGKSKVFKRVEVLHKLKCFEDSNKQIKNTPSHINNSNAVINFNEQRKERNSQNEKQCSTDNLQKEKLNILNRTQQQSFESLSSLNKQRVDSYFKNKTENSKKLSPKNDFTGFTNQNKNLESQHSVEAKKNKSMPVSSKKKRKSKIKRQVAMQSDKIRIITPEMFSKIMNSSNDEKVQSPKNIAVNIYDSNEYPELGSSSVPILNSAKDGPEIFSKKDTPKKFNLTVEKNDIDSGNIESLEENSHYLKDQEVLVESNFVDDECCELKKLPVHYNNPITISLVDVLSVNKLKKKESDKSKEFPGNFISSKFSLKKQTLSDHHQIVNPLDSSKPAIKRGKERENPKPKRLSKFKKIILLDREKRKEQMIKQYMWNKLHEEKDVFSQATKSNEIKTTASNFSKAKMQHFSQINNGEKMLECNKIPEHTKLLNLYSLLENVNIVEQNLDSCANVNEGNLEIKNKNDFLKEKSNYEEKPLSADSVAIFLENEASYFSSQTHSNDKYKMKLEERKTNEHKFLNPSEVHNFVFEEIEPKGESNKFSKSGQNYFSNPSLINETESSKCINSLTTLYNDICYESSLNEIQYLFENWGASKMFSEEQNLDEILCDIQYLFLRESDTNIFSCTKASTELHYNFINDVKSNEKNNMYNLSIPEKIGKGCDLIETLCHGFQKTDGINNYKKNNFASACICETENVSEKRTNCALHCISSDEEILKAANIILHSKKFRDYCTHFSSKELGETVLALLDDLTRFQDRVHQKDPVKARMKRRLIYGIKEIKRHMKLKKLKCIIIATDIEDSKTEGSLNDIINDLKALAKDYHVPCVFSHLRKKLGQICHKPAPVSAVGVLNYEGSEINFKKILELQTECKLDYEKVLKSLLHKLTDVQVELLHTTKANDSARLYSVVTNILKELFPNVIDKSNNNQNIKNIPEEASAFKESHKINEVSVEAIEMNNILIKYIKF